MFLAVLPLRHENRFKHLYERLALAEKEYFCTYGDPLWMQLADNLRYYHLRHSLLLALQL
jgi:hypothetical protein